MRRHLIVLASLFTLAAARQAVAEANCSKYTLEGVSVGMTLEEAHRTVAGSEVSKRDFGVAKADKGRVWCLKRPAAKKEGRPRVFMLLVLDGGGAIASLTNSYVEYTQKQTTFAVEPEALVEAFRGRFGPEADDTTAQEKAEQQGVALGQPTGEKKRRAAQTRTVSWQDAECDVTVLVDTGTRLYTPGAVMTALVGDEKTLTPVLEATIARKSWRDARLTGLVEQKVRF